MNENSTQATGVFIPLRKRQRCSRGHEWETDIYTQPIVTFSILDAAPETFCLKCVLELLREHAGTVEDVPIIFDRTGTIAPLASIANGNASHTCHCPPDVVNNQGCQCGGY